MGIISTDFNDILLSLDIPKLPPHWNQLKFPPCRKLNIFSGSDSLTISIISFVLLPSVGHICDGSALSLVSIDACMFTDGDHITFKIECYDISQKKQGDAFSKLLQLARHLLVVTVLRFLDSWDPMELSVSSTEIPFNQQNSFIFTKEWDSNIFIHSASKKQFHCWGNLNYRQCIGPNHFTVQQMHHSIIWGGPLRSCCITIGPILKTMTLGPLTTPSLVTDAQHKKRSWGFKVSYLQINLHLIVKNCQLPSPLLNTHVSAS